MIKDLKKFIKANKNLIEEGNILSLLKKSDDLDMPTSDKLTEILLKFEDKYKANKYVIVVENTNDNGQRYKFICKEWNASNFGSSALIFNTKEEAEAYINEWKYMITKYWDGYHILGV